MRLDSTLVAVTVFCLLLIAPLAAAADEGMVCPECLRPIDPGARYCTNCGHKMASPSPVPAIGSPVVNPGASVIRVVAAHDKEMTSAYGAIAFGSTLRVDSMLGSGFAIARGEFITDSGLVTGVREVFIYDNMMRMYPAEVVGVDHQVGVALLRSDAPDIPPLKMRNDTSPRIGETVRAYGYPSDPGAAGGLLSTSGVLSGMRRSGFGIHPIEDYQQSDATLPAGFAGGPVIDEKGRLVGMSTALPLGRTLSLGPVGIGLSVPVSWIERSLQWIRNGLKPRPWLGVIVAVDDRHTGVGYGARPGAVIEEVYPGSPAARAGLQRGDILMHVNGVDTSHLNGIRERLLDENVGASWSIEIERAGELRAIALTLVARPASPRLSALGALRAYGGIELWERGAKLMVKRVLPDTLAQVKGIEAGDKLQAVLIKKDLTRADRGSARWRSVRDVEKLEKYIDYAYSDLDFFVGLKFKTKEGPQRRLYLHEFLITSSAL